MDESRELSHSQVKRISSEGSHPVTSSRKFMVEIDPETNDIIGVKEMSDEEIELSASSGSERNSRGRGMDSYKPVRARSRSILRSSSDKSSLKASFSTNERVKFAMDAESDDERRPSFYAPEEHTYQGRGRSMQDQSGARQSRSLSRQRMQFNDVDFDPKNNMRDPEAHAHLMERLEKPPRPYEQDPRKTSVTMSSADTSITIDEEEDDDDSFGHSFGSGTMKDVMHSYTMEEVAEEVDEEDATILSGCPSYADERNHRYSMPDKPSSSSRFKNKLKPVGFHIRKTKTAPQYHCGRESNGTEGTAPSTDDEGERSPSLFVNRAADSLMLHQKHHQKEFYEPTEPGRKRGKSKSRLSKIFHR
jgi:hypothetical protein